MADTSAGWVKLFRGFTQWGWYTDVSVKSVYIHLILTANSKDTEWNNITIRRGQLVTSYRNLGASVGLDAHSVHRAVKKLIETGEITVQSNAKFSIITLNNYDEFQGKQRCANVAGNVAGNSRAIKQEYKKNIRRKKETPAACSADAEDVGWRAREGHDF